MLREHFDFYIDFHCNALSVTVVDKTIINVIIPIFQLHKSAIISRHYNLSLSCLTWVTVVAIITK